MVDKNSAPAADLDSVRAAHETVKMKKTELQVMQMEGELIDVGDVRKMWGDIANSVMRRMIELPGIIAGEAEGATEEEIKEMCDREIRKALEDISETPLPKYLLFEEKGDAGDE
jgi:hypothetical protein